MSRLEIRIRDGQDRFRPGETVEGAVSWQLDGAIQALELRLIWFTEGKGDSDVSVEQTQRFEAPSLAGDGAFRFVLPDAPYSFSGSLISVVWALELVTVPGHDAERSEFTFSPTGEEVVLPEGLVDPALNKTSNWLKTRSLKQRMETPGAVRPSGSESPLQQRNPFD